MLRKSILTGLATAVPIGLAVPSHAADVNLKVSTCFVKSHDQVVAFFKTFVEPLNAMKDTGLKLTFIGGPETTPRQKQASSLQRGLVDIINCPSAYYQGQVPAARTAGVNTVPPAELRKNGGWEIMQEAWDKGINARILGWGHWEASTFFIYMVKEPKPSDTTGLDLSGLKMRSTGLYNAFMKKMAATPVNISAGDVYAALERGLVDGLAWPEGSVAAYGWQKFLKYKVRPNFYHSTTMTIMNLDKYKSLSKKHQELIDKQGLIYENDSNPLLAKLSVVDNDKLEKAGIKNVDLTGKAKAAYLKTIYGAKWAENDTRKYSIDYKKLKSLTYGEPK